MTRLRPTVGTTQCTVLTVGRWDVKTLKEQAIWLLDQLEIDHGEAARAVLSWSPRFDRLTDEDLADIEAYYDRKLDD